MDILDQIASKGNRKSPSNNTPNKKNRNKSDFMQTQYLESNQISYSIENLITSNNIHHNTDSTRERTPQAQQRKRNKRNQNFGETTLSKQFVFNQNNVSISECPDFSSNFVNSEASSVTQMKWGPSSNNISEEHYMQRSRFQSRQPSKHSLGVILSDDGEDQDYYLQNKNAQNIDLLQNNFSFHKSYQNGLMGSNFGMMQTQSRYIPKQSKIKQNEAKKNEELQREIDKLREQIKNLEKERQKYKKESQESERRERENVIEMREKMEQQKMNKILEVMHESKEESLRIKEKQELMYMQQIKAKQETYLWQIQNLKQTYQQQIQGLKDTLSIYKQLLHTQSSMLPNQTMTLPHNKQNINPKSSSQFPSQAKKLQQLYDQFYKQKLLHQQKIQNEHTSLFSKKQELMTKMAKQQQEQNQKLFKRQSEIRSKQHQIQKKQEYLKEKQYQIQIREEKIEKYRKQSERYNKKIGDELMRERQALQMEKNRVVEMERLLVNKIRVVEMYSCKRQKQVPEIDDAHEDEQIQDSLFKQTKSVTNIIQQPTQSIRILQQAPQQKLTQKIKKTEKSIPLLGFPPSNKKLISSSHKLENYLNSRKMTKSKGSLKK